MRKLTTALIMATAMLGSSPLEAQEPLRGDYRKIAACVYKALDPMSPGNFQIATLPDEIIITFQTSGGGMTFRDLEATFSAGPGKTTLIKVDGRPPGYYPQKVRPLAAECAAKLQ